MMQCRMCSQRLTRPGRLCRECGRELDRARARAASVENLSSAVAAVDARGLAVARSGGPGLAYRVALRSRTPVVVAAFLAGIAAGVTVYFVRSPEAAEAPASVMIDRDLSHVRPRVPRAPAPMAANSDTAQVAGMAAVSHQPVAAYDRVLGLADALDRCARELPFARMTCEYRARSRYCTAAGANRIPQCAEWPAREEAATLGIATPN